MSPAIQISDGIVKIVSLGDLPGNEAWLRLFQDKAKDHRYYEIAEQSRLGEFEYHYLVFEDNTGRVRGIQPVFFVRQNLVEGVPGKIRELVDLVRKVFPRLLTMRGMMVG